ncbi:TolC family protein [Lutimonas halocynthiae]|uniref:TolC family protein n=1 Tax=Lutimonas halocynthiae TaxID=1446477 RepID=UPI0025B396DD|nr:TolC family protein [Lutimonas halocynthiae]MDN3642964.1 TolC family protein [Lutimonas halocynthiae]
MKLINKYLLLIILYGCFCSDAWGQTDSITKTTDYRNGIKIPSLYVLIDSAINHNAMVRYRKQTIGVKEADLKSEKLDWTRNFGIQADGRYGNFNNNSISVDEGNSSLLASSTTQFNYGVGLYLKFPVFDGINRRNQVKKGKIEMEQAKSLAEAQKDEVRQLVIKQYQELTLKQKLLIINSQNLGNAKVNMEMVEKEFRSGVISIYEYVRLSDMTSRIESDYENAKSDFLLAKKLMENLVGFSITKYQSN